MAALTYFNSAERAEAVDGMVRLDLLSGGERVPLLLTRHAALHAANSLKACVVALERTPDTIIPLCELCIRHDLPRDTPAAKREG